MAALPSLDTPARVPPNPFPSGCVGVPNSDPASVLAVRGVGLVAPSPPPPAECIDIPDTDAASDRADLDFRNGVVPFPVPADLLYETHPKAFGGS